MITLEVDPKHAGVAQLNISRAGLQDVVEVRIGNAVEILPQLSAERRGPFDLIFIDADKPNIPAYFEWALKLCGAARWSMPTAAIRASREFGVSLNYSVLNPASAGLQFKRSVSKGMTALQLCSSALLPDKRCS